MERKKAQERAAKFQYTLALYGLDPDVQFDTNLYTNCENRSTGYQDNGGYAYNFLDRLPVQCGDQEVLAGFKLSHSGSRSAYNYKCCKPRTSDNRIKPIVNQTKSTETVRTRRWNDPWNTKKRLNCPQFLNGFSLQTNYRPNRSNYNYKCSVMNKDFPKDIRNPRLSCATYKTNKVFKHSGTQNLQNLNVQCPDGMLKDVNLIEDRIRYGYQYTCCKPYT